MKCPKCGNTKMFDFDKCPSCGHVINGANIINQPNSKDDASSINSVLPNNEQSSPTKAVQVLIFFAWLDLIVGIIGAIIIWSNYGKTIAPDYYSSSALNPLVVGLGFVVLFQGIFCCAFFLVIAQVAENINTIKITLLKSSSVDNIHNK